MPSQFSKSGLALFALVMVLLFFRCTSFVASDKPVKLKYPSWFPEPVIPIDNALTEARIELGRRIFFDTRLSDDGSTSCGTCHVPSAAFTDGQQTSTGSHQRKGKRNAPTLANVAWQPYFMAEGGVPSLELQSLAPMHDTSEMNMDIASIIDILKNDADLNALAQKAYGKEIDAFVVTRALASFERTLISGDSRYDRLMHLGNDRDWTADERAGMSLFFSPKTKCFMCHSEPFFTDFGFYNVGLYEEYADHGRERVTYKEDDIGKFKTPTLRNIELTAPYMHDGSVATLEEVVELYNTGGKNHPNKDRRVHPLNLSDDQKRQLVAFMKTLTDWNFVQNKRFMPAE